MIRRMESGIAPAKFRHEIIAHTLTGNVLSLGTENTVITPPAGVMYQILNMYFLASDPIGSASGTHSLTLMSGDINILNGSSVFGSDLKWDYSRWETADSAQRPATDRAAQAALNNTHFVKESPLTLRYFNGTDVSNILSRYIKLSILETPLI